MRVAQIGFYNDPNDRPPEELLAAWPTLVDVAESVATTGASVSVIQSSGHSRYIRKNGIDYHFLPLTGSRWQLSSRTAFATLLAEIAPHVLHVHGLGFPREVLLMADAAPGIPILVQDHANRIPPWWRLSAWKRCAPAVAGVAFCARQQARPFIEAGVVPQDTPVYEIPESTSRFMPGDREVARREVQVTGDPLLLWVGHLNDNKDPLTVLAGVSQAARELPQLQLWCCSGTAPLLRQVQHRIDMDRTLRDRVHLLGRVPHDRIEQLMRAADVFVLGSHREGSGYSLIEALACALPPVVTDIPSFRALTGAGAVGQLWQPGNPGSLCAALLAARVRAGAETRPAVRAFFDRELSFEALSRKLTAAYRDLLDRNQLATRTGRPQDKAVLRAS